MGKKKISKLTAVIMLVLVMLMTFTSCTDDEQASKNTTQSGSNTVNDSAGTSKSTNTGQNSEEVTDTNWLIYVYMCGSDLESGYGAATLDLEEMLEDNWGENVTFVVQTGGSASWNNDMVSADKLERYEISDGEIYLVDESESASMGAADTLADFVSWGNSNYSAQHTGFVFWNHGGGSITGVCFDELYDYDSLSLDEIDSVFESTLDVKYDFVGFDACLMGTIETANLLEPYSEYMIASEESEPGYGWDYTVIGNYLKNNGDADMTALGTVICDGFYESCEKVEQEDTATLALLDLSKIGKVNEALEATAEEMNEISGDIAALGQISTGINKAENYGGNTPDEGYTNMIDLGDMVNNISDNVSSADNLLNAIDDAVVYKVNGASRANSHGLSIYYPLSVQGSEELDIFSSMCASKNYEVFVNMMIYGAENGNVEDYDVLASVSQNSLDWSAADNTAQNESSFSTSDVSNVELSSDIQLDEDNYYYAVINPDTLDYVQSVQFSLMADWYGDGTYYYLGNDNNLDMNLETGRITDNFLGEWPALPDGQLLMYYIIEETEDYTIFSAPVKLNGSETNLRFLYDYNAEEYQIIGTWDGIDSETGVSAKDIYQLQVGDIIEPYYMLYDSESDSEDEIYGDEYTIDENFVVEDYILPEGDYYYSFEITDIFGLYTYSDLAYFNVDEDGEVYIE